MPNEKGRLAPDHGLTRAQLVALAKDLKSKDYNNAAIANIMRIPENYVRMLLDEINWGYNCLTGGVHHGRPEAIWNLPLFQSAYMFGKEELQELVLSRIYNDAMQYVECSPFTQKETGETTQFDRKWAEKVRAYAEEMYLDTLKAKIGEISNYYQSSEWKHDQQMVVWRVKENKLNPGYEPRHPHDSINLLCRIIGSSASRAVS